MGLRGHSSWFLNAEVDGAQDGSWRHHCLARLYLAAKLAHVRVDVDGLACPLHHPMVYDYQMRGQSFLSGAALSHHATVVVAPFRARGGGVRSPQVWIFDMVLTVWVPM
jgi:hypothetical protein